MIAEKHRFLTARPVLSAVLALAGVLILVFPQDVVTRAYLLSENPQGNISLIYGLGLAFVGLALAVFTEGRSRAMTPALALTTLCAAAYFVSLTLLLRDWWIDDAGITFAYSRSLAEGHGLVAQPWLPPEEGYSSSVWMLLLSAGAGLGTDIPQTAKTLGIGFSLSCIVLSCWMLAGETRSPLALMLCGVGIACGPTVVWAASGQEHALQALILLGVVGCVYHLDAWRWPVAGLLTLFVLTRPEAPLVVIAVFCAAVLLSRRDGRPLINAADIAVALLPFLAFVALLLFRLSYFGDLMPNPYYAKSTGTSLTGLLNPLGGGWAYILAGLRDTALILVLALAFWLRGPQIRPWVVVALAILAGHVTFVVWAKGDWMSQYRFLMPVVPVLLLVVCLGLPRLPSFRSRAAFTCVAVLVMVQSAALQLAAFAARPTTPLAVVTTVGETFEALAGQLDIDDPVLAHHDAGGISYHRMIRLIDLGGLVNRTIAQNMNDRAFLTRYLLEETQPDFVFGARNFAAATGFSDTEAFAAAYAPLDFVDRPAMDSALSYIRRDRARPAPGVELVRDARGGLARVRVTDLPEAR